MIDRALALGETGDGFKLTDPAAVRRDAGRYLRRLAEIERGHGLPAGWVTMTTRWLLDGRDRVVGEVRVRHRLTADLEVEGGHVGYFVHPDARGLGHGTAILALALNVLAGFGVDRALVTCDDDNARSRRVILGNGGVFRRFTTSPRSGKRVATFWVPTRRADTAGPHAG